MTLIRSVLVTLATATESITRAAWWSESSLANARSLAMVFDRESRRHNVYREGNLLMSEAQLEFYFEVARAPWIKTICETGFNAGHSAAVFLNANPQARVVSFDLGQFDYTLRNLRLMKDLFPERFDYVLGDSYFSIIDAISADPTLRCDLIAIDGTHDREGVFADLTNFKKIANCRNFILADDTGFAEVNAAWQQAKDAQMIFQSHCMVDLHANSHWLLFNTKIHSRSWCLGWYNQTVTGQESECPPWLDESRNPNTNVTKCDIL